MLAHKPCQTLASGFVFCGADYAKWVGEFRPDLADIAPRSRKKYRSLPSLPDQNLADFPSGSAQNLATSKARPIAPRSYNIEVNEKAASSFVELAALLYPRGLG